MAPKGSNASTNKGLVLVYVAAGEVGRCAGPDEGPAALHAKVCNQLHSFERGDGMVRMRACTAELVALLLKRLQLLKLADPLK